jgi:hypothetical protein
MEEAIEKYIEHAKNADASNLLEETKKFSLQFVLQKIPNIKNEKRVLWFVFNSRAKASHWCIL